MERGFVETPEGRVVGGGAGRRVRRTADRVDCRTLVPGQKLVQQLLGRRQDLEMGGTGGRGRERERKRRGRRREELGEEGKKQRKGMKKKGEAEEEEERVGGARERSEN